MSGETGRAPPRTDEAAVQARSSTSRESEDRVEANLNVDRVTSTSAVSLLAAVDRAARAEVLHRLQRTRGNAFVQRIVARTANPAVQRQEKPPTSTPDKSDPAYKAPAFESVPKTAVDVQDAIKNDRFTEACHNLNRLWIRDIVDTLKLVQRADASLPGKLQGSGVLGKFDRVDLAFQAVATGKMPVSSTVAADQQKEVQAFTSVREWPTKLPHAARDKQHAITVDPKKPKANVPDVGEPTLTDEQATVVDFIRRERALIQVNPGLHLAPFPDTKHPDRGYQFTKSGAGEPNPTAMTTGDQRSKDIKSWVWKEVAGEGSLAAINTYDEQILTYGKGFGAAHGSLGLVMRSFLKNPTIEGKFLDAGIVFRDNTWLVVNTATGYVEEGENALRLIQFDQAVLSRLIEVGQDNAQEFADAQWDAIKGKAGAVPASVASNTTWTEQPVRLVAHCIHWRPVAAWSQYTGTNGVAKEIVKVVVPAVPGKEDPKRGGATFVTSLQTHILRSFANGFAGTGMSASAPLPANIGADATSYRGHVFFDAGGGNFYHIEP